MDFSRRDMWKFRIQRWKEWYAVRKLRKSGELDRILAASPYRIITPGGMGHQTYDVVTRDDPEPQDRLPFSGITLEQALLWLVERYRDDKDRSKKCPAQGGQSSQGR